MTIPDLIRSLVSLAVGAGIYLWGYRNGAKSKASACSPITVHLSGSATDSPDFRKYVLKMLDDASKYTPKGGAS